LELLDQVGEMPGAPGAMGSVTGACVISSMATPYMESGCRR
jgi:hypothetical protein